MQRAKFLLAVLFAGTLFLSLSCSKSDDQTYTVEYKLQGNYDYVQSLRYRDATGNMVIIDDPALIGNGIFTVTVTKPFDAQMNVVVNNSSVTLELYILSIAIDGVEKSTVKMHVPLFDANSQTIGFSL